LRQPERGLGQHSEEGSGRYKGERNQPQGVGGSVRNGRRINRNALSHRLNMELDLQSLVFIPNCSSWRGPAQSPHPRFWAHMRGRKDRGQLFVTPCFESQFRRGDRHYGTLGIYVLFWGKNQTLGTAATEKKGSRAATNEKGSQQKKGVRRDVPS
jgi:hypothetical protein